MNHPYEQKLLLRFLWLLTQGHVQLSPLRETLDIFVQRENFWISALRFAEISGRLRTNDSIDTIQVEVMRVTNPAVESQIHELELGVGYYYDEVMIRGEMIGVYLFHEKEGGSLKLSRPLVADGDWVEFLEKQR